MAKKDLGLTGIGHALVDVLCYTDEDFLARQAVETGMQRGKMNLVDASRAHNISIGMHDSVEMSGGSAANSVSAFASFGGKAAFIGKVAGDQLGETFRNDLQAQGIEFATLSLADKDGPETGRSYILVTPDGERTMNTYLGASRVITAADIDESQIARSKILLLEGYLFDTPKVKEAFRHAAALAKKHNTKVAFTLSDSKCVERHLEDFRALIQNDVDILIGNKKEIMALTLKTTFEEAAKAAQGLAGTAILTRGAEGALIVKGGKRYEIPAIPPEKLVDTTGAGDAFAGGVLYGISRRMGMAAAGLLAAKAASKTISHIGARSPGVKFSDLLPK